MDPRALGDDTELCLSARALTGDLRRLSQAQRELLKAVGQHTRISEIVRYSRLPERLAKQHLKTLLDQELISFKLASSEFEAPKQTAATIHEPVYELHPSAFGRRSTAPLGSATQELRPAANPPTRATPIARVGAASTAPRGPGEHRLVPLPAALNVGSDTAAPAAPPAPVASETAAPAASTPVDERPPVVVARSAAARPPTLMPSTLPQGTPPLTALDAAAQPPPAHVSSENGQELETTEPSDESDAIGLRPSRAALRPPPPLDSFEVDAAAQPSGEVPTDGLLQTGGSGEVLATSTEPSPPLPGVQESRPPPLASGFEQLRPITDAQSLRAAVGAPPEAEPPQAMLRVRIPKPDELEASSPLAGEVIPLIKVVRHPVVTLGGLPSAAHFGAPIQPTGMVNLKPQASAARSNNPPAPGEQPAVNPNAPQPQVGTGATLAGVLERSSSERSQRTSSQPPQSGSTIEGMPAQDSGAGTGNSETPGSSTPARTGRTLDSLQAQQHAHFDHRNSPLAQTWRGGLTASSSEAGRRRDKNRPSVVVRAGSQQSGPNLQPTGPTGRTLVGVLSPTAEEIASAGTRGQTSTSTTMPSLNSNGVHQALTSAEGVSEGFAGGGQDETLDHYQVLECLAKGGSGVVYRVQDPKAGLSQSLALKVLREGQHNDEGAVAALQREAELMSALDHRNLVRFVHFGHERDEPFLLMEYIEGLSMSALLHHPVPLPLDVGLIIIQDALDALDYVHNARVPEVIPNGLVHCDVSPQNLLVGADDTTRLIDFGTSRAPGTPVGSDGLRCKPRYSSPEMMGGDAVGPETDIFSMGAVLFQLLSKQPAFSADPKRRKKESLVPNPSLLNRRAPTPFDAICQRALDPDPERRFSSAREMLETLDDAVETSGIELRRARVGFWVRRVIQSHHGDVEFDMSELEDLLDSKRRVAKANPPTTRERPPSEAATERRVESEPTTATSTNPPSSSSVGAASKYTETVTVVASTALLPSEKQRRRKTWLTVGAIAFITLVAIVAATRPGNVFTRGDKFTPERPAATPSPAAEPSIPLTISDPVDVPPPVDVTEEADVPAETAEVPPSVAPIEPPKAKQPAPRPEARKAAPKKKPQAVSKPQKAAAPKPAPTTEPAKKPKTANEGSELELKSPTAEDGSQSALRKKKAPDVGSGLEQEKPATERIQSAPDPEPPPTGLKPRLRARPGPVAPPAVDP